MNDLHRNQLMDTLHMWALNYSITGTPGSLSYVYELNMNEDTFLQPVETINPTLVEIANILVVLMHTAEIEVNAYDRLFKLVEVDNGKFTLTVRPLNP